MSRRRGRKLPKDPIELEIDDLSHDGRGVATWGEKKVFIHGALPGERVLVRLTDRKRSYDEAETVEVLEASPDRVEPRCPHFGQCGGCSLQHLGGTRQIESKQNSLLQNLQRIGKVVPVEIWKPLMGIKWQYRRKARLSVRYVHKKERVLVGFRERYGRFVADMQECHVLDPRIAEQLSRLSQLIFSMDARSSIPQLEVACGDESCALVFRHMQPLSEGDQEKLRCFARETGIAVLLQPKGPATIHCLEPDSLELGFRIPDFNIDMAFEPLDFVQVNAEMNLSMIARVMELLDPGEDDRVLDLFCGLGNFTLPIATRAFEVVGIEGDSELVSRAQANAGSARRHCPR
jgi:23S rRNA (uracil1939-C5)-methyltransferase